VEGFKNGAFVNNTGHYGSLKMENVLDKNCQPPQKDPASIMDRNPSPFKISQHTG
jgi:hypothetical protein